MVWIAISQSPVYAIQHVVGIGTWRRFVESDV